MHIFSICTLDNLKNIKKILDGLLGYDYKVALLTSDYHIQLLKMNAKNLDMNCFLYPANVQWYITPIRYLPQYLDIIF